MKIRLFFLLVIILFKANAQNGFNAHVITTASDGLDGVTSIAAGDIDGDGDIDIISTSQLDRNISWYKNLDGNGIFARPIIIENNLFSAFNLYLIDMDGDTDLDILVSSERYEEDKIFWYENTDGSGNFGTKQLIYTYVFDGGNLFINHADVDGDGDIDILCATYGTNQSLWLENNNGVFIEHIIESYSFIPSFISIENVNGDDKPDLVVASSDADEIYFHEGIDGLGAFGNPNLISDVVKDIREYYFKDIDNDGDNDVVTLFRNKTAWFENLDGLGTFGTRQIIQSDFGLNSIAAIDVDMDGDWDIVTADASSDRLFLNKNLDGLGDFGPEIIIDPLFDIPIRIISADVNGDGYGDVISTSAVDQSVDWYENLEGSGNFGKRKTIAGLTDGPWMVNTGDLDGDGLKDIVCAANSGDKIVWFKNLDNEGLFSSPQIIGYHQESTTFAKMLDIDSDGDLDILLNTNSTLKWYENIDGQGNFGAVHMLESDNLGITLAYSEDINGDGLKDIVTFSTNYGVYWYENIDNTGIFGTKNIVNGTASPSNSFHLSDLDSDGDMDIVVCYSENKIAWFKNNGVGIFGTENLITTDLFYAYRVYSDDVDNDGDNDIIAADFNKIVWFENLDGIGDFGSQVVIDDSDVDVDHITLFDLDGDGDLDVIASIWSLQKIVWYPNLNGQGDFGERKNIGSGSIIFNVDDIDNDGDLDVIAPLFNGDKITWFENSGNLGVIKNLVDDFMLFPNPSTNEITIKAPHNVTDVKIYNSLGQLVLSEENSSQINISTLKNGLYIVKALNSNGKIGIKKLIKK
ncbi:MAG: T9SS type A sorting domain-containing protein [Aequorivita sp.]